MIITLTGANFANSNIGTLDTWTITRSLGKGTTYSGPVSVDKDAALNATVTLTSNYEIGAAGVSVTMGGEAVEAYTISGDGLTVTINIAQVTGNVVIRVPTTGEEELDTYTITYVYVDGSGVTVKASDTETVTAGTVKNFATTDSRATVDGYTCNSVSLESATVNENITVTYTYTANGEVGGSERTYTIGETLKFNDMPEVASTFINESYYSASDSANPGSNLVVTQRSGYKSWKNIKLYAGQSYQLYNDARACVFYDADNNVLASFSVKNTYSDGIIPASAITQDCWMALTFASSASNNSATITRIE